MSTGRSPFSRRNSSKTLLLLLLLLLFGAQPFRCCCCSSNCLWQQQSSLAPPTSPPPLGTSPATFRSVPPSATNSSSCCSRNSSSSSSSNSNSEKRISQVSPHMGTSAVAFLLPRPSHLLRFASAAATRRPVSYRPAAATEAAAATAAAATTTAADCTPVQQGTPGERDFAIWFKRDSGSLCSPWHDVSLIKETPKETLGIVSSHVPSFDFSKGIAAAAATTTAAAAAGDIAAAAAAAAVPLVHFVVEIPCGSSHKNEILIGEPWNPIRQDTCKDGREQREETSVSCL